MRKTIAIALCALLASPAVAESIGEKTGINSVLGLSPTTHDFVQEAATSDMFEIESSKLAEQQADDATKAFAKKMIADHTKTSEELKAAVASDPNTPLPTALDGSHQSKLDKLKGLTGDGFTKQYRDMQVTAHENAVSLFERYAKGGDSEKLKSWAAKTLPDLQRHLEMAQALEKGGSTSASR
jgi:putative membrane protein